MCLIGAVAHRSEQAAHNHLVDSSTLSSPTKFISTLRKRSVFLFTKNIIKNDTENPIQHRQILTFLHICAIIELTHHAYVEE